MDAISMQEAKKAQRKIGNLANLKTFAKDNTVNAINELKDILGLLVPEKPETLSNKTLRLDGAGCYVSTSALGCSDVGSPIRGTLSVYPKSELVSSVLEEAGVLSIELDGQVVGSKDLNSTTGTFGDLIISRVGDFPVDKPGFYKDMDIKYQATTELSLGYHELQIKHSGGGSTNVEKFIIDDIEESPTVVINSITEDTAQLTYSSGIAHYSSGSKLRINASVSGAVSMVYSSNPVTISGGGINDVNLSMQDVGVTNVPSSSQVCNVNNLITLNQAYIGVVKYNVIGKHPLVEDTTASSNENILVKIGEGGVDESKRLQTSNEEFPNENQTTPNFDSNTPVSSWEAKIVGGVLKHDVTNYSSGYLPVGVNYSSHNEVQYASFVLPLVAKTNATLNINGTYEKCYIKLPNVTGWLDTSINYAGAGNPVNDGEGCKINNNKITFGTNSTAYSNNKVIIRFKLTENQNIINFSIS